MNLTELTTPATVSYPLAAFKDHLRLGSGFVDDSAQDDLLIACLATAITTIEARTGKVLLEREYSWEIARWHTQERQGLPVSPVSGISAVSLISPDGSETVVDPGRYGLRKDDFRPELFANNLPAIPTNGIARVVFAAGFGGDWSDIPADLSQAVLMLAANFYDDGGGCSAGSDGGLPFGVQMILERYRPVRLMGDRL